MGKPIIHRDDKILVTTHRRRPFSHGPLIDRAVARIRSLAGWGITAYVSWAIAALTFAVTLTLPLLASSSSAVDVEDATRASAEITRLQNDADGLPRYASLDVAALLQDPELPTGCESVALTNALLFYEFDLTKTEIAQTWLPTSDTDFVDAFLGDPFSSDGHAAMPPAIVQAATSYLEAQGSTLTAVDITDSSFEEILTEVAQGHPVVAWCTIGLEEADEPYQTVKRYDRTYGLYANSHTVVVRGYDLDASVVFVSDSLSGQVAYDLETFAERYYAVGSQAIVIR